MKPPATPSIVAEWQYGEDDIKIRTHYESIIRWNYQLCFELPLVSILMVKNNEEKFCPNLSDFILKE